MCTQVLHMYWVCSLCVSDVQEQGIVEEVFKEPEKLHLTLGVLRIFSKEEEVRI